VLLSSATILGSSRAAFSDQADNAGNYVTVGNVILGDDDGVAAMFEVDDMAPGDSETNCILVTYSGSIADPGEVVIYSGGFTDSDTLADELNLMIEEGSAASFGDCSTFVSDGTIFSGTLTTFDGTHTDYSSGAGTWDPSTTPESTAYRITVELDANADTGVQGESVTNLTFVWEVRS
jgi:hypothetical protein